MMGAENWSHHGTVFANMIHDKIVSQQLPAATTQPLLEEPVTQARLIWDLQQTHGQLKKEANKIF